MNFNTFVVMKKYKGKNIRVSDDCHEKITVHIPKKISITGWVEEAVEEKILREQKKEKVVYDKNGHRA